MKHHHHIQDTCESAKFIFEDEAPKQPKANDPPLEPKDYVNLLKLVEMTNKSTLFIAHNEQTAAFAKKLDNTDKDSGQKTFPDGVHVRIEQTNGNATFMQFDDPNTNRKETVTTNEHSGIIESDKVDYCGYSRTRHFKDGAETYHAVGFPGGKVETDSEGNPQLVFDPVMKPKQINR